MTRLTIAILVLAGAWMVWWAIGSSAHERGLSMWIEARRAEGWAADVVEVKTAGFPNRFDTELTSVSLADPATGIAWSAPFIQFLSLAYKPHQVIAVLPESHVFSTPLQTMTITHDEAKGSLFLEPSTDLGLDRSTFVITAMTVRSSLDWAISLDQARLAAEKVAATPSDYRVGLDASGLRLAEDTKRALDPTGALPEVVQNLNLDATLGFTAPWDRHAIEDARPQVTFLDLTNLSADWGNITFRAAGELSVDADGVPTGQIDVRAVEWRRLLDMAIGSGVIADAFRGPLEGALELIAGFSGRPDTLDAPLTFRRGQVRLGPVPLGPAPRIIIR